MCRKCGFSKECKVYPFGGKVSNFNGVLNSVITSYIKNNGLENPSFFANLYRNSHFRGSGVYTFIIVNLLPLIIQLNLIFRLVLVIMISKLYNQDDMFLILY